MTRRVGGDSGLLAESGDRGCRIAFLVDPRDDFRAQTRHRARQFVGAPWCFAQPERNGRRLAVRILDPHAARFDAPYLVRRIAQLENIAGQAFHGEILVHGADDLVGGLQHDLVVRGIGNGAARSQRGEARATPAPQNAVHGVAVDVSGAMTAPRREPVGQHAHHIEELVLREVRIRIRASHQIEQVGF